MAFLRRAARLGVVVTTVLAAPAAAQAAGAEPFLVLRAASIDRLLGAARYVVTAAGAAEASQKIDAFIGLLTQGKGLIGVDRSRPLGLAAICSQAREISWLLCVPVKDPKALGDLLRPHLQGIQGAPEGVVPIQVGGGKYHLHVTRGHCFVAPRAALIERPEVPASLSGTREDLVLDVSLKGLSREVRSLLETQIAGLYEAASRRRAPAASGPYVLGQEYGRAAAVEGMTRFFREAERFTLSLTANQGSAQLELETEIVARPRTQLERQLAAFGREPSAFSALASRDAPISFLCAAPFPRELFEQMELAIGGAAGPGGPGGAGGGTGPSNDPRLLLRASQGEGESGESAASESPVAWVERVRKVFAPGDEVDLAFLLEAAPAGKPQFLLAAKVSSGEDFERLLDQLLALSPADSDIEKVERDVARHGGARIHAVTGFRDLEGALGPGPLHLAVGADRVFLAGGPDGLARLKTALERTQRPGPRLPAIQLSLRPSKLAALAAGAGGSPRLQAAREALRGRGDHVTYEMVAVDRGARSRLLVGEGLLRLIGAMSSQGPRAPAGRPASPR
ncbi:MAG: hypothetical protein HY721_18485 [Planctomycetes bacterium]|nr:hypothetical protein [Planctomycetota bacterium]